MRHQENRVDFVYGLNHLNGGALPPDYVYTENEWSNEEYTTMQ